MVDDGIFGVKFGDYWLLMKPRVMFLVVVTGVVGMLIAPGDISALGAFVATMCIALASGGAAVINMWYDRDIDLIMERTRARPIPAGRVAPVIALWFGLMLALVSFILMGFAVNYVATVVLVFSVFFYAVVYTMWLKRRTVQNIVIGGVAGALPPVIGWAVVTHSIGWESIVLFLIIFLWTPPHFWCLAIMNNEDYARAGVPMMTVVKGIGETKKNMVMYSVLMFVASLVPVLFLKRPIIYAVVVGGIGLYFNFLVYQVWCYGGIESCRKLFRYTISYLFMLFATVLVCAF